MLSWRRFARERLGLASTLGRRRRWPGRWPAPAWRMPAWPWTWSSCGSSCPWLEGSRGCFMGPRYAFDWIVVARRNEKNALLHRVDEPSQTRQNLENPNPPIGILGSLSSWEWQEKQDADELKQRTRKVSKLDSNAYSYLLVSYMYFWNY